MTKKALLQERGKKKNRNQKLCNNLEIGSTAPPSPLSPVGQSVCPSMQPKYLALFLCASLSCILRAPRFYIRCCPSIVLHMNSPSRAPVTVTAHLYVRLRRCQRLFFFASICCFLSWPTKHFSWNSLTAVAIFFFFNCKSSSSAALGAALCRGSAPSCCSCTGYTAVEEKFKTRRIITH